MDNVRDELARTVQSSKAPAISRAAAILRLLGKTSTPLSLNAISNDLGLPASTCLYALRALTEETLVAFDPDTKRYALEAGVLALARQWLRRNRFTDLAQSCLDNISSDLDLNLMAVQILGLDQMIVVATAPAPSGYRLGADVGARFPALLSATGRCIAAFGRHSREDLEPRFRTLRWDNPPSFDEWLAQADSARAIGIGMDEGQYMAGVTVMAAPVLRADDTPSHALVAIGVASTLPPERLALAQTTLRRAAQSLTQQMTGSEGT